METLLLRSRRSSMGTREMSPVLDSPNAEISYTQMEKTILLEFGTEQEIVFRYLIPRTRDSGSF